MSDPFQPIPMEKLAAWIFDELEHRQSIFGIPRALFFTPGAADLFASPLYGRRLETPFGVAAGPHSQMAQNIVVAWLCGARFIELKTVQTLDELEISKPCIDLHDEGYNVEWSQELKIHESFDEYVRAWVLVHALHRKLGWPGRSPGAVFNMSVGYNMDGLLKPNMQWYLRSMRDASERKNLHVRTVRTYVPDLAEEDVPALVSDNVTLSTMHGCPPAEIEKICACLISEWGLHTNVKLNPTLLGPQRLREILNDRLGFHDVVVPDEAFEHDLRYGDAVPMLRRLAETARARGVEFGVKLTNTLEVENFRDVFAKKERMMYLSGRALHPVTVNVAAKLAAEFDGRLPMSFSAGADAFNVADLLRCGMKTVTVCSDILKSGGYLRIRQYIENTVAAMAAAPAKDLESFRSGALPYLRAYADRVPGDRRYHKDAVDLSRTKTARRLDLFDCIQAPCADECPINQKVPRYMNLVREGRYREAVDLTRDDNPLSAVLGRACNHLCENVCVRSHLDEPLAIREIKRFIMDQEKKPQYRNPAAANGVRVAVIGGGPCGLSASYFLAQAGFGVTVFETRPYAGGMVAGTIPVYRAGQEVFEQDLEIIRHLGVEIRYDQKSGRDYTLARLREGGYRHIVIAAGAQRGKRLGVEGDDRDGVLDALTFLRDAREGHPPPLGARVGVVGGGDVAMDCARTAWRLGRRVTVIYRRTRAQMPADPEEIEGLLEEGIEVIELAKPLRVLAEGGKVTALECRKMKLGEKDASGRRRPLDIPDSEFVVPLDTLIPAISQEPDLGFLGGEPIRLTEDGFIATDPLTLATSIANVYAGGDVAAGGPQSIVKALGDGQRIAATIVAKEGLSRGVNLGAKVSPPGTSADFDLVDLLRRRAHRVYRVPVPHLSASERKHFREILQTYSEEQAKA